MKMKKQKQYIPAVLLLALMLGACTLQDSEKDSVGSVGEEQNQVSDESSLNGKDTDSGDDNNKSEDTFIVENSGINLVGRIKLPEPNKASSSDEVWTTWSWNGDKKQKGSMKGVRLWFDADGNEHKRKVKVESPYVVGQAKAGDPGLEISPVCKMVEHNNGELYFLCNAKQDKPWQLNYLVTTPEGNEIRGGKLNLKKLVKNKKEKPNRFFWINDMEVSENKIIAIYKSSPTSCWTDYVEPLSTCGVFCVDTKTGKWWSKQFNPEYWWGASWKYENETVPCEGSDLCMENGYIYAIYENKTLLYKKYEADEEYRINLPQLPFVTELAAGKTPKMFSVSFAKDRVYLLDAYGNRYVCDIGEKQNFTLVGKDSIYVYPAYTMSHMRTSQAGDKLFVSFWEGEDDCFPKGYRPYVLVSYEIKREKGTVVQ